MTRAVLILSAALAAALPGAGCGDTIVRPIEHHGAGTGDAGHDDDRECAPPATRCEGGCFDLSTSNAHCGSCEGEGACSLGSFCVAGSCVCGAGETKCNGVCSSLGSNPANCGACEKACADDQVCVDGNCADAPCGSGHATCDGKCVDVQADNENCGDCDERCSHGKSCLAGLCICPGTQSSCDGVCVELGSDPEHCGGCDVSCGEGSACVGGQCT